MKTYTTAAGNVEILDARIVSASGYGQYTIVIDIEFKGENKTLNIHSTDSRLFDKATDDDFNHSEVVLEDAKYTIESAIDDYIGSL